MIFLQKSGVIILEVQEVLRQVREMIMISVLKRYRPITVVREGREVGKIDSE